MVHMIIAVFSFSDSLTNDFFLQSDHFFSATMFCCGSRSSFTENHIGEPVVKTVRGSTYAPPDVSMPTQNLGWGHLSGDRIMTNTTHVTLRLMGQLAEHSKCCLSLTWILRTPSTSTGQQGSDGSNIQPARSWSHLDKHTTPTRNDCIA